MENTIILTAHETSFLYVDLKENLLKYEKDLEWAKSLVDKPGHDDIQEIINNIEGFIKTNESILRKIEKAWKR